MNFCDKEDLDKKIEDTKDYQTKYSFLKRQSKSDEEEGEQIASMDTICPKNLYNTTHFEVWSGFRTQLLSFNEWNSLSPPFNFPKSQFPVLMMMTLLEQ